VCKGCIDMDDVSEGGFAVIFAVAVSVFISAGAWTLQCASDCFDRGTCSPLYENQCSFRNSVTPAAYRLFNLTNDGDAIGSLTRGVCAPGERQNLDRRGNLVCVRAPAFPDAYMKEIESVDASSDSRRTCGRWIDARSGVESTQYWSFFDAESVADDVEADIRSDGSAAVAFNDIGRFRVECERMILNAAAAPSASNAYEHLKGRMPTPTNKVQVLQHVGVLLSHYCDAPVLYGIAFGPENRFSINATSGSLLDADAATEALYAMGEHSTTRHNVREFISELESAPVDQLPVPTADELGHILDGAVVGSWVENSLIIQSPVLVQLTGTVESLVRFLHAVTETSPTHAHAYLLAVTSQCAFSTRASITGEFGANGALVAAADSALAQLNRPARHRAHALGRLRVPADAAERFSPVDSTDLLAASTTTWGQLRAAQSLQVDASPSQAVDACFEATKIAFADALDMVVLQKLTTPHLIDSLLPPLVDSLKEAVAVTIQNGKVAPLIPDVVARASIATDARNVHFRIAGAARESRFGREDEFERPDFRSDDGALLLLLKQAKAVFLDRIRLALDGSDLCQHPVLYPSTSRNAYLLTAAPCAMMLPGILVPPFASDRYSQTSLYGRIGFVIAHEVAHVASKPHLWDSGFAAELMANYTSSTWVEAAADLTAASALVSSGRITASQACDHISQLWCARTTGREGLGNSHPGPNMRGDFACAFLRSL
jgi:hypothetical protein